MSKTITYTDKDNISVANNEFLNNSIINRGLIRLLQNDIDLNNWKRKVAINEDDSGEDYLASKIIQGSNITLEVVNSTNGKAIKINGVVQTDNGDVEYGDVTSAKSLVNAGNFVTYFDDTGKTITDSIWSPTSLENLTNSVTTNSQALTELSEAVTDLSLQITDNTFRWKQITATSDNGGLLKQIQTSSSESVLYYTYTISNFVASGVNIDSASELLIRCEAQHSQEDKFGYAGTYAQFFGQTTYDPVWKIGQRDGSGNAIGGSCICVIPLIDGQTTIKLLLLKELSNTINSFEILAIR